MSTFEEKKNTMKSMYDILSREDIDKTIQNYTNEESVQVLDYQIEDYSKTRAGHSQSYKILKITFQKTNSTNSEIVKFFFKLVPYEIKGSLEYLVGDGLFLKETIFYRKLVSNLSKNLIYEKLFPTSFFLKEDAIILNDLRSEGYKVLGNNLLNNTDALKSALVALARFHASSIIMEHRLNRNSKEPVSLDQLYPDILYESFFTRKKEYMWRVISTFIEISCAFAKHFNYDPELIRKGYEKALDMLKPSKTYRNVICHGDLWSSNIMFSDNDCILIDFQCVRYAPIAMDLLHLLHLNTTRTYREKNEKDLVRFYHSTLEKIVAENDVTASVTVSKIEEIFAGMDELRLYGLIFAAIYCPITMMEQTDVAEYTKDSESYYNFSFVGRVDLSLDYLKKSESYRIRNEECIVDLAEKCKSMFM